MRLTLIDLLIWAALAFAGFAIAGLAIPPGFSEQASLLLQSGAAVAAYIVGASVIYRRMRFWPLLFPVCPHCEKRPDTLDIAGTWPVLTMSCGSCRGRTELRMHKVNDSGPDNALPCLQLKWPHFLGWYKRVR